MDIDIKTETEVFIDGLKLKDFFDFLNASVDYSLYLGKEKQEQYQKLYKEGKYTECYFMMKDIIETLVRGYELIRQRIY